MIKISVTNINFYNKNYLILTNFKKSNFMDYVIKLGEGINGVYSDFFIVTVVLASSILTSHTNMSPLSIFSMSLIVFGIDVDNVPPVAWTFVSYFNFIPPFIQLIIFILLYYSSLLILGGYKYGS